MRFFKIAERKWQQHLNLRMLQRHNNKKVYQLESLIPSSYISLQETRPFSNKALAIGLWEAKRDL
jgi:hypothetical protein